MKKPNRIIIISVLAILVTALSYGQSDRYDSPASLQIVPGADIPLGSTTTYFEPGIIAGLNLKFTPKSLGLFNLGVGFDYLNNTRAGVSKQYLNRFALTAGGGVRLPLTSWLSFRLEGEGGVSVCMMDHDDGTQIAAVPVVTITAGPAFEFLPWMDINIQGSYQGYLGLSNSISVSAGLSYRFKKSQNQQGPPVLEGLPPKIINIEFDEIFPVFYSYYDNHPAGTAIILNPREDEITDITLDFYVNQYMDTPKRCATPESLGPGETGNIDIIALFNNSVLDITEGTKVAAKLTLSYKVDGVSYTDVHSETMRMQYRNAMTWDDDRRAAAFVTAKDPAIMSFAKNVVSMLHGRESASINRNLQRVMAIHEALALYGMTYVIDPTTSYAELSESETSIDFLQFPRETLEYRAGDCDDLSILHSALFEALGMETAFVTVPGHIFMAVNLGIPPNEAARTFYNRDNLIIRENKVWIPFEITALQESFIEAWDLGARQWNQFEPDNKVGFFPIRSAWEHYEPVGLPGTANGITRPLPAKVVELFEGDLVEFIAREMTPQEEKLKDEIRKKQGAPRSYNKLGVLYARYGKIDAALAQFEAALENEEYAPALLNIGNIRFLEEDLDSALTYYKRAEEIKPNAPKVLLALARTQHSLGNNEDAAIYYNKLKVEEPEMAGQFSYLDTHHTETERAANINDTTGLMIWDEEIEEEE